MVSGIPRRTDRGLTIADLQRSFSPSEDVEDDFVVDAEVGTKLGTAFKELVRLLPVQS